MKEESLASDHGNRDAAEQRQPQRLFSEDNLAMEESDQRTEFRLEDAYRSNSAAEEYFGRHRKSAIRRFVSLREARIVMSLLRKGGFHGDRGQPGGAERNWILDAPCGTGRMTSFLQAKGIEAATLDSSFQMIVRGKAAGIVPGSRAVAGTLNALPFRDKAFRGAICIRFMHHLDEPEVRISVLRELRRTVDGPVVISVWAGPSIQWTRRSLKKSFGRRPSSRFRNELPIFEKEAAQAGWRIEKIRYLFRFVSETAYVLLV